MKSISLVIALCVMQSVLFAQDHYRLSETGMQFKFHKNEEGHTANIGELVSLDMVMIAPNGEVLRSSYKEGKAILFPVKISVFEGDIYEAITLMSENDSAEFLINADSMYTKVFRKSKPSFIKAGENLKFMITVHEIYTQEEYKALQEKTFKSKYKESDATLSARRKKEDAEIVAYLKNKGISNYKKTEKGVYYSETVEGKGRLLKTGDAVVFHYKGALLNGNEFESTFESGSPFSFTIDKHEVIAGWEDSFKQLTIGSTNLVIVPSDLAYGGLEKGDKIPAHSVLVFEVKVISSY